MSAAPAAKRAREAVMCKLRRLDLDEQRVGPTGATALAEALDCVSCVCVGSGAADAAAAVLRDNCAGSFIVELDSEPSEHPSSWSHLKGFRRMGAALCGNQPVS